MAVIRFTAADRDELPSWLAAGATFYLANKFQAFPRRLVAKRETDEALDGTPESYLHALQREYSITTDFIPIAERDLWRAFFSSVLNAETFAIDLSATQLLANPGFESGALGAWSNSGAATLAVNTTQPAIGSYALEATLIPAALFITQQVVAAPAAATYVLQTLASRSESSLPNRNVSLSARWGDSPTGGSLVGSTTIGSVITSVAGWQIMNGEATAVALTQSLSYRLTDAVPNSTDEAGVWYIDHNLLAKLSTWLNVWLVDNSVDEQQIGGVGVQYRFRVKTVP